MEILQLGGFAVLVLGGIVLLFIFIIGGMPKKGQKLKGLPRLLIGLFGVILLYLALVGLGLFPNPLEAETESTPTITAPTGTPVSEITPIPQRAVQVLDKYYQIINNAANKIDLEDAWNYLSPEFQCLSDDCDMENYKDFWWSLTIEYELYDCSTNTADVNLTYYYRSSGRPTGLEHYLRYTLEEGRDNQWFIINGIEIEGTNCDLYTTGG